MLPHIHRILYATDLSECARHAIRYAAALGLAHGARVTALTVVPDVLEDMSEAAGMDLASHFGSGAVDEFRSAAVEQASLRLRERVAETVREFAPGQDGKRFDTPEFETVQVLAVQGDPAAKIIELGGDYDLIVMGTHGMGGLVGRLIGSVAEKVVRHSPVPVMVVPLPEPVEA